MIVGYCRINTIEPASHLDAQKHKLAGAGAERFFFEQTGFFGRAPQLEQAIEFVQKGDQVLITKPYRIAYTTSGVFAVIERLWRKGAGLRILNTPVDTSTTTGRMILGSAPRWSLGISPIRSLMWDLTLGGLPGR